MPGACAAPAVPRAGSPGAHAAAAASAGSPKGLDDAAHRPARLLPDPAPGRRRPRRPARTAAPRRRQRWLPMPPPKPPSAGCRTAPNTTPSAPSSGSNTPQPGARQSPALGRNHRRPGRTGQGRQRAIAERFDASLSRYDRVNAARAVDDLRLAQSCRLRGAGRTDRRRSDPSATDRNPARLQRPCRHRHRQTPAGQHR